MISKHSLNTITFDDFHKLLNGHMGKYYIGRWAYFKEVVGIVHMAKPKTVLELGPGQHTIVKSCDIMVMPEDDAWGKPINEVGRVIFHDATEKPWPVTDKYYEMFIALQVWEHLGNKQSRAFREVMRTSKSAILSFPYMWDCPRDNANYPEHHMIDEELIADWTLNVQPKTVKSIERTGPEVSKGPRVVYYWEF